LINLWINTSVYRRFTPDGVGYATGADDGSSDDPVAHGIVKEFWLENGLHRWRILYDDSHVEDFDKEEMMEFGLDRKSGSVATFSHSDLPATASTDHINSNPWVTIKAKRTVKTASPADRKALLQEIVDSQQPARNSERRCVGTLKNAQKFVRAQHVFGSKKIKKYVQGLYKVFTSY
jgi:hypothetical protein